MSATTCSTDPFLTRTSISLLPSRVEILSEVGKILQEACGVRGPITSETRLAEDLALDSVGLLTLALEVENRYELFLEEDPLDPPQTVGDLVELVERRLAEQHSGSNR
ncbi:MAG: acyl carrier protein [Deltaproteobacteria bacterium]|nr:MAG: acyl carrier protein [Deltaproteobacteria bacterium]